MRRAESGSAGVRTAAVVASASLLVFACSSTSEVDRVATTSQGLDAVCQANVVGLGLIDTESDYLPHVVACENGDGPFEALKAQAIAARTFLYYKMEIGGSIRDGQNDQAYSCVAHATPSAAVYQAVAETSGLVLRYSGVTICAFFVDGGAASPPSCVGNPNATNEPVVTYNKGLSGTAVHQSTMGFISPTFYRNRGCLSQNAADCLASTGVGYVEILHTFYGEDIGIEQATGSCVVVTPPPSDSGSTQTGTDDSGVPRGQDPGGRYWSDGGRAPNGTDFGGDDSLPPPNSGCSLVALRPPSLWGLAFASVFPLLRRRRKS